MERMATLFPPFTLGASLQQSIARSTGGTDRCAVAQIYFLQSISISAYRSDMHIRASCL